MCTLHLSPIKVTLILLVIVAGLLFGGIATQYIKYVYGHDTQLGFVRLFDLDGENNLPSWYSSVALLLCSGLLVVIGLYRKREGNQYGWHWLMLAFIFLYLSADEAASIHEMVDPPFVRWLDAMGYRDSASADLLARGTPTWVLAGIVFTVIVFLLFWRFLQHLPFATKVLFLIAGGLYIVGAIVIEEVSGIYIAYVGRPTFTLQIITAFEEGLEMVGVVVFFSALMSYMAAEDIGLQVVLDSRRIRPAVDDGFLPSP